MPQGSNQQAFLKQNLPLAHQAEEETGIPWQVYIGIAANETGWGSSSLARDQNNFFSIKGQGPAGSTTLPAWEVENGQNVTRTSTFRAYADPLQSYRDFNKFLHDNSRYQPALKYLNKNPSDWRGFLRMVNDAGYATDPIWADKVVSISNGVEGTPEADSTKPSKLGADKDTQRVGITGLLDTASTAIGSKYVWGGAGGRTNFDPKFVGSDCSGFVAWAYEKATGIRLPAQTQAIWQSTSNVRPSDAMPGDLVMYNMGEGAHMEHVGIYAGNGMMIHDSSINPNGGVDITPLWSGAQFRRVDGVDPSLYNRSQGGGLKPKASEPANDWVIKVQYGREILFTYTPDGRMRREDMGKSDKPNGTILGFSGSNATAEVPEAQPMGTGQDEQPEEEEDDTDYSFLDTPLSPQGEGAFQIWKAKYAPRDSGWDYDLRGAFAAGLKPDPQSGHWPDTYKKPNHPTFSDQSKFARDYPDKAGRWDGDQYIKPSFLNPSTGSYEPLKAGAGADVDGDGIDDDTGLPVGPSSAELLARTGGWATPAPAPDPDLAARLGGGPVATAVAEPEQRAPAPTAPISAPLSVPERKPISPAAQNRLKPGESLDRAIQTDTVPETLASGASDVGQAAGEMASGVRDVAGDVAGGIGGAVGGVFSGLGSKAQDVAQATGGAHAAAQELGAKPIEEALPDLGQVASATGENIGGAASALGTTVSNVPLPENRSAQDVLDQAGTQKPASQEVADALAPSIADPGTTLHDLSQDSTVLQALPTGSGELVKMIPGIAQSVDWLRQNGYDTTEAEAAAAKLMAPWQPDPSLAPIAAKAAAGGQLDPGEWAQVAGAELGDVNEVQNNFSDFRKVVARSALAPEIRDTPEGQEAAEGAAFVTDPTNLAMLADPALGIGKVGTVGRAGKIIIDGTEVVPRVLTGDAARAAAEGVAKHAPEFTDFVRPLTQAETETVLQRAALDLNDSALDAAVKAARDGERYEPLTGDQVRRQVMNAVARSEPGADAQTVLNKTDDIMRGAGMDILGDSERAGAYGSTLGERIGALREIGLAPEAQAADRTSLGLGAKQAGAINTKLAIDLGGAAAGYGVGVATEDPNDPNYYGKVAAKTLAGLGSTAAVVHGAAYIPRGVSAAIHSDAGKAALYGAREFFAPAMNLTDDSRSLIDTWAGKTSYGEEIGKDFTDRLYRTWGKRWLNLDTLKYIEENDKLPPGMLLPKATPQGSVEARATLDEWRKITRDFAAQNIVPNDINFSKPGSKAKLYVPHVVDDAWKEQLELGRSRAQPGRVSTNPFWSYNQPRQYETLADGQAAGVTYLNENIAEMLGRYYSAGIRSRATEGLVDALEAQANRIDMTKLGPTLRKLVVPGEDVVRVGPRDTVPKNSTWLGDIPGIGNKYRWESEDGPRTFVSNELAKVFRNMFRPEGLGDVPGFGHLAQPIMSFNSALKHNTLSGSMFHLINEFRQFSATQGFNGIKNLPSIIKGSVNPGEFRAFMSDAKTRGLVKQAMEDNLGLNLLAEHDVAGTGARLATTALNTAGGAALGYGSAAAAGLDPQDQLKWTLAGAGMGLATTVPGGGALIGSKLQGMETKSLVEAVSESLWNRTIPMMKLTTYEMYAPQYGGKAAAEFANSVFGGNNLTAIARSRMVQDAMRMSMLAPDWTESWARLIGTSALDTPTGQMARQYWANAAVQSTMLLEGMNLALGGHFSWQNDPDHVLEVDATNLYHRFGWSTKDANGKEFTPYIDVLGPYKGLLQPIVDLGRAATVAAAKRAGVDPMDLPGGPAIAGYFPKRGESADLAIPRPNPGEKFKNFASARGSMLGTGVGQILDDHDFAGRPLDRTDDSFWQQALNRVNIAAQHMLPTGVAQVIKSGTLGEPALATGLSAATGARLTHGTEAQRFFDMQDEFVADAGKDPRDWQQALNDNRNANLGHDQTIDGLVNEQKFPDLTYRDRGKAISDELGAKKPESELRKETIPAKLKLTDPAEDTRLRQEIEWLDDQDVSRGGEVPADLDWSKTGIDLDNAMRMAWNRDPELVERLQGGGRRGIASQAGLDALGELAKQRQTWTADVAAKYGIDYDVLQDALKASMYGDKGGVPPPIPGVTSGQLDDIIKGYQNAGQDDKGNDLDISAAQTAKSKYLSDTVAAINAANPGGTPLTQENLARRITLRKSAMIDQTPEQQSYDQAQAVRQRVNTYRYLNPDGTPMGDAADWDKWDNELNVANNRQQKYGSTFVKRDQYGDYVPDDDLNTKQAARQLATANTNAAVLRDQSLSPQQRDAFYKWYGEGAGLTPSQWKEFKDGTLDMWSDAKKFGGTLPKDEWNRRVAATRLWSSLTPQGRLDYDDQNKIDPATGAPPRLITWKGQTDPDGPATNYTGTLSEYMAYLRLVRNQRYSSLKLDPEDPEAISSGG